MADVDVRPWQTSLEDLGRPQAATGRGETVSVSDARALWLDGNNVAVFQRVTARARRVLEALVLFAQLSQADRAAWRRALCDTWRSAARTWCGDLLEDTADSSNEPVLLGVVLRVESVREIDRLRSMAGADATGSEAFQKVYKSLGGENVAQALIRLVPVRLVISCRQGDPPAVVTEILAAVCALVQARAEDPPTWWWIREITVDARDGVELPTLDHLAALARLDVQVPVLPVLRIDAEPIDFAATTRYLRSVVLNPSRRTHALVVKQPALVPAVLSCAQESRSVESVHLRLPEIHRRGIDDDHGQQEEVWKWVAYALFSRDASHTVTRLGCDFKHLRMDHVEAMRRLLAAENPLRELFLLQPTDTQASERTEIVASRFFLENPLQHPSPPVFESIDPVIVRVIDQTKSDDVWGVLLQGYGQAWVHHDHMLQNTGVVTPEVKSAGISELVIESMNDQSLDASTAFLGLVGERLHSIRVDSYFSYKSLSSWCSKVFDACPQLTELELGSVNLDSLDVFVDCVASGTCTLKRLEVTCQMQPPRGLVRFLDALADPRHPLSKSLARLKLSDILLDEADIPVVLASAQRMLETNRRLHTIDLHLMHGLTARRPFSAIDLSSLSTAAEARCGSAAPLTIRQRLGLLSSFQANSDIVRRVFGFAAARRARRVELRYHDSIWAGVMA